VVIVLLYREGYLDHKGAFYLV